MEKSPSLSEVDTTAASSSAAEGSTSNIPTPGGDSLKMVDATDEETKLKEIKEDDTDDEAYVTDLKLLLIEDSTLDAVPIHLRNLFKSCDVNKSDQVDLLMTIIYALALECSFGTQDEVQRNSNRLQSNSHLSTFHVRNVRLLSKMPANIYDPIQLSYNIRLQLVFHRSTTTCLMMGIVTGDLLILTLLPDYANACGKSICLSIGRYVLNLKGRPFPSRFRNLSELSFKIREQVLIPVRNDIIKEEAEYGIYPGLDGLPYELYIELYSFLNENNLNKMANVSQHFLNTVRNYKEHLLRIRNVNE